METGDKRQEQKNQCSEEVLTGCENIDDLIDLLFDGDATDTSSSLIKAFCKYKDVVLYEELKIGDDENV